ncbi:N-acetylglucosamine/diacetylchitobiose ABC transporter substrate-binding protein [Brachybacterium sp. AOP43-C2-M15]|uniref:N-acetylglucosamine/diacetylchitobiose ABC transporter substrate-binding protein n=1 Tax=Brachybacterium sp. AOP43-C2-M15 TaxID=3457661 RepID=UPI00403400C6
MSAEHCPPPVPPTAARSTRRTFLGLAGALGAVGLSACATSGAPGADAEDSAAPTSPENPFGVSGGALNAFVFDGGGGVPHLDFTEEQFLEKHPEVETDIVRAEDLSTLQPRFVGGTPPDLFQNSGAGSLDITSLTANDQLASLEDLLAAPSWDDPEITVEESLNPGVREAGIVDGQLVGLNTAQYAWGIWRDAALFEEKGWEWPTTWDELMSLSADIKADGIYPWAFTGMHANYFDEGVFVPLAAKIGGQDVWRAVDDLEDGAWQQDAIREAAEAVLQLRTDDLILPGVAQMTHVQSQTAWLNHEAALIPVGAWLENEMRSAIPEGFRMTAAALPSPDPERADLTPNNPGAGWFVPAAAAHRPAAFEFLRALLSKDSARHYAEQTNSVTMVAGAHDDQQLSEAFTTITDMIERSNRVEPWQVVRFPTWYPSLAEETRAALMALILGDLDVDGFLTRCQTKADQVADDDAIAKQTR